MELWRKSLKKEARYLYYSNVFENRVINSANGFRSFTK